MRSLAARTPALSPCWCSALLATAWAASFFCTRPLVAQTLPGHVRALGDSTPIAGVLVVLLDSAGVERDRAYTNASGAFTLRPPGSGTYDIHVLRIGYRRFDAPSFVFDPAWRGDLALMVESHPLSLATIDVSDTPACDTPRGDASLVATLWEQIATALGATVWTIERHAYRFRSLEYVRRLDVSGRLVSEQDVEYDDRSFEAAAPDSLMARGFVQDRPNGPTYYAPDAQVLFSEVFARTHCFGVRKADARHAGGIGVTFRPIDADRARDVRGVVWIDASMKLQDLSFEFTAVPGAPTNAGAGGDIFFAELPDGGWFVDRWSLKAPATKRAFDGSGPVFGGYVVRGGSITAVYTREGVLLRGETAH